MKSCLKHFVGHHQNQRQLLQTILFYTSLVLNRHHRRSGQFDTTRIHTTCSNFEHASRNVLGNHAIEELGVMFSFPTHDDMSGYSTLVCDLSARVCETDHVGTCDTARYD